MATVIAPRPITLHMGNGLMVHLAVGQNVDVSDEVARHPFLKEQGCVVDGMTPPPPPKPPQATNPDTVPAKAPEVQPKVTDPAQVQAQQAAMAAKAAPAAAAKA